MTVYSQPSLSSSSTSSDSFVELDGKRNTIYENVRFIYTRTSNEILYSRSFGFEYDQLVTSIKQSLPKTILKNGVSRIQIDSSLIAWEIVKDEHVSGIITNNIDGTEFENWFIKMLISTAHNSFPSISEPNFQKYTDLVANLFIDVLKYTVENDQWDAKGEAEFKKCVNFFTSRWAPIEACLPAFPCKSSNLEKVSSKLPDKGEELALQRLIEYSKLVKKIYPPGFKLWIVSDGHVFSDCIGVDDDVVDIYGEGLKRLYEQLKPEDSFPVEFQSLPEIFSIYQNDFKRDVVDSIQLNHYLNTQLSEEAELCRKILVQSCDTDCGQLRKDVNTVGHPRVQLYRGFSKFMLEDLALLDSVKDFSRKQLKKTASKVSFEMIKRNDAYSNLIELIFPFHLRLSIHAHNNGGPKFGIKLLSADQVRVISSVEDFDAPENVDCLHIPTPWHNSILKIDEADYFYVIKSGCITESIEHGRGKGEWNKDELYFEFTTEMKEALPKF